MAHADAAHPLLAGDEARYAGQAVALVLATSRALAEDAAELVEVDYEPLDAGRRPAVGDRGAAAFRAARAATSTARSPRAAHVVRARHAIPRVVAAPIEPRGDRSPSRTATAA